MSQERQEDKMNVTRDVGETPSPPPQLKTKNAAVVIITAFNK
jgi:hypothetical protein